MNKTITKGLAPILVRWFKQEGGATLWHSMDLGNPEQTWWTPITTSVGPHWSAGNPEKVTDPASIVVEDTVDVKSFHVALRSTGPLGTRIKVSDGGSRRIFRELGKFQNAGKIGSYRFNYGDYENVTILELVPVGTLVEYMQ